MSAAYCEVEDVKARAGVLADAWDDSTNPSNGDIERFIRDAGATVNVALAAHGFDAPATDARVTEALTPIVADMALLMAVTATWPAAAGGNSSGTGGALYAQVAARVADYVKALANGDIGFLMYLREISQDFSTGAADFWSTERDYSSYLDDLQTGVIILDGGGVVLRSRIGPEFHKDMRF